ncbi:uncharacterized protein LOC109422418 isoform X1 [Aedes albopictus]|uniref:DH domain-containing protein n=1 Tax=Aedes albopictus TaxID=7160 RepID=A0ABM1ZVK8_AEDAL
MNKNRPLPPPKPGSHEFEQELPPPLPPKKYKNKSFSNQQKVTLTKGNQIGDSKVQKLVQEFQGLITKSMNAEPDCPNNVINPTTTDDHIYDEVSFRSSTSGSCSAETEEQWSDFSSDSEHYYDAVAFDVMDPNDSLAKYERQNSTLKNAVAELLEKEQNYIDGLMNGILYFIPLLERAILPEGLRGQRNNLLTNIEEIHKFHQDEFLPALQSCNENVDQIAECFIRFIDSDKFYCYVKYAMNRRKADTIFERHRQYFTQNQMVMQSFPLLPIQQLPRYKLFMEKFIKETLKLEDDINTASNTSSIHKAHEMISQLNDLVNAAVSICHIPECESEFVATTSFSQSYSGFNRENDQVSVLILKPESNKQSSRNNPIDLFAQGKFTQVLETDIYDTAHYRWYKARFFVFEKLIIYTEIVKDTFPYRGHYFDSEINHWTDHKKLHLFCLQRGTQEIQMHYNKSIEATVTAIRQRVTPQFSPESEIVKLSKPIQAMIKPDFDMENSITAMVNSQIQFVKTFRENVDFYLEIDANFQVTHFRKFREVCLNMLQQHERVLSDLSSNAKNMSKICTMFLQYVKVDFPCIYGEYLKTVHAGKFIRTRITPNVVDVLSIDDFLYLCIDRLEDFTLFFTALTEHLSEIITKNVLFDKTLFQQVAIVQVQLEKFSHSVGENFRLLCLDDGVSSCGLALVSEQIKIQSGQLRTTNCRIFICERAIVCVACSFESRLTKRSERFDEVVFFDRFSGSDQPMRMRKSMRYKDMIYFTIEGTKYSVKFKNNQARDKFHANYVQQYVSVGK